MGQDLVTHPHCEVLTLLAGALIVFVGIILGTIIGNRRNRS